MVGFVGLNSDVWSCWHNRSTSSGLPLLSVGLAERLIGIAGKHLCSPPPKLPVEDFVDSSYDGQLFSYLRSEDFTYRRRKGELFDSGE